MVLVPGTPSARHWRVAWLEKPRSMKCAPVTSFDATTPLLLPTYLLSRSRCRALPARRGRATVSAGRASRADGQTGRQGRQQSATAGRFSRWPFTSCAVGGRWRWRGVERLGGFAVEQLPASRLLGRDRQRRRRWSRGLEPGPGPELGLEARARASRPIGEGGGEILGEGPGPAAGLEGLDSDATGCRD